ncbi:helix-turn-helix transcriptional regulator [Actinokineospora terrae]|uniref:HTH cro/C1-type domain-containing protein n=1 Tax=Actinokineospora terrae TaxID=155974 RepID=A0A1H9XA07_9PSEU|nr:helix-turn-helix transcriptional regulator [Actinokineospora terrae]SES42944.1 hypothetical protein SAMN04487818_113207 [Actinokineospora terrae]
MPPSTLADKIDHLFKTIRPGGREYSYDEVARGCAEVAGGTFSKTYVWQLRTGQRDNPTKRHLEAVAAFFQVPVSYFFEDETTERVDSQLALAAAMRDADVRDIALRASHLDPDARRSIVRIMQEVSRLQRARSTDSATGREDADDGE